MFDSKLLTAYLAAFATLLIWSGTAIANKIAVSYMDGLSVGLLRVIFAGFVSVIIVWIFGFKLPALLKDKVILIISGVSSFALWPILMSLGIQDTTAGHAAVVMTLIPLFTVLITSCLERTFPALNWWFGAIVAFLATIVLLVMSGELLGTPIAGVSLMGDFIVLVGSIVCAIGYISGARISSNIGSVQTTFLGLVIALIIVVPVFFINSLDSAILELPVEFWLSIAWMAILSSIAGYVLWLYALANGGLKKIATLQLLLPVLSIIFAYIFLDETITYVLIFTCTAILSGVYYAQKNNV